MFWQGDVLPGMNVVPARRFLFGAFLEIADWKLDFLEPFNRIGVLNAFKIIPTLFSMLCAFWQSSLLCQPPGPLLVSILRLVFLDAAFTRWQSRLLSSLFSRLLVGYFVTRHQKKEKGRAEKPDASTISFLALFLECLFCGCSHILCSCFDPPSTVCSASLLVFPSFFPLAFLLASPIPCLDIHCWVCLWQLGSRQLLSSFQSYLFCSLRIFWSLLGLHVISTRIGFKFLKASLVQHLCGQQLPWGLW